jgi:hypothetical protein
MRKVTQEILDLSEALDQNELNAIRDIIIEYNRACEKHVAWPSDLIHAGAIVAEEAGELTRATLQVTYEDGNKTMPNMEAIQVGAMAIRFISNSPYYSNKQL